MLQTFHFWQHWVHLWKSGQLAIFFTSASWLSLLKTDPKMCLFFLTLRCDPSIAGHWLSGHRMVSWRLWVADARHSLGRRDSQGYKYINTHRLIPVAGEALAVCISPPGPAKAVSMRCSLSSLQMPSGSNFQICLIFVISSFSAYSWQLTADFFQQSSVSKREFTKTFSNNVAMIFFKFLAFLKKKPQKQFLTFLKFSLDRRNRRTINNFC